MNRETRKGISEHYRSLEKACVSVEGVELIGLFKPLSEPWNWTQFLKVDSLEKWRIVDKEIYRLYPDVENNVSSSMSRLYWDVETDIKAPPIRDPKSLKYLVMDFNMSKEANLGIMEYYAQRCEQFAGLEGAGLLGLFQPMTESWNAALLKLFDSLTRYMNAGMEYHRTYRRIPEITSSVDRVYERYEP